MIISKAYALANNISAAEILAIADWHMERIERDDGERHDLIAFRLFKLARELRA